MKFFLFFAFFSILTGLLFPMSSFAAINLNLDYPELGNITLDQDLCNKIAKGEILDKVCGQNPNALIAWIYQFIVIISGLAAFVIMIAGGVQWLISGAAPSQASEAKDKIKGAVLGLLLILSSFLIVQIVNPELTVLSLPGFDCPKNATGCNSGKGENPVIALPDNNGGNGLPTPARLPKTGADAVGIYLCRDFECACAEDVCRIGSSPNISNPNPQITRATPNPLADDALFIAFTPANISLGSGSFANGISDLGNWNDNIRSIALKTDAQNTFDVLLADDEEYEGVVICFSDNSMGGKLSEFERVSNVGWHSRGTQSLKFLNPNTCINPGITLRNEPDFWKIPTAFVFTQTHQGRSDTYRYKKPASYAFADGSIVSISTSNPKAKTKIRSTHTSQGFGIKLLGFNVTSPLDICFVESVNDLSTFSLDPIGRIQAILATQTACPNPGVNSSP